MLNKMFAAICIFSMLIPYIVNGLRANNLPMKHKEYEEISYDTNNNDVDDVELQGSLRPDISDDDLLYFYDFCLQLPHLEKIGRIPKNRITQSTCKKLHIILDPLFHKTSSDTKTYKWF